MKTKATSEGPVTKKDAKRLLGVARVVAPAVAPYAMRAATAAREGYDRMRAHRLGVPIDELGSFSGKGAALHARIAGDLNALSDLPSRVAYNEDEGVAAQRFAEDAQHRLGQLTTAVRAAERMPVSRRRATHRAVTAELDRLEDALLHHLHV